MISNIRVKGIYAVLCVAIGIWSLSFTVANTADNKLPAQLNTFIDAYSSDFESLKGDKSFLKGDTTRSEWKSKVLLEGASETYIAKMYATDTHLTLFARFSNYETKVDADKAYKELVEKIKQCRFNCGEMQMAEGKDALKIFTNWSPKVITGANAKYSNMVLQVKLTNHNYGDNFNFYSLGLVIFKK